MEDWEAELRLGRPEAAWDRFLDRYRRLVLATIRHYAEDYDDVMDVFARVCEALREDDFRRLRQYASQPVHRARFGTWLVSVVRNLTVDWFRHRDGRRQIAALEAALPPVRQRIFELVFRRRYSHVEAYERLRSVAGLDLSFTEFLAEVAATYRAVTAARRGDLLRDLGGAPPVAPAEPVTDPPEPSEMREAVAAAMDCLAPEERVAVELYVLDELPAGDVARILGLPNAKAVYNRVYRALAALRERFERAGIRRGDL